MIIVIRLLSQILSFSLFLFMFSVPTFAQDPIDEAEIEDVWTVNVEKYGDAVDDWVVVASVNGKVTDGDRFRIRMPLSGLESCTMGNTMTTFFTMNIDSQTKKKFIKGKLLPATLNADDIHVKVLFSLPFINGHLAYVDIGWNKLENIKEYFRGFDEISLTLKDKKDSEGITIINSDYFDVSFNNYSTKGLNSALDRARAECERLVNNF
jgi:hypothetical protein